MAEAKTCRFAGNDYCATLPEELRVRMCEHCHIREYPKGTVFPVTKWRDRLAVLARGITMLGQFPDLERPTACRTAGIATTGTILSLGGLITHENCPRDLAELDAYRMGEENICLLDTAVAVFDVEFVEELYRTDIAFVRSLLANTSWMCGIEGELFHREQGSARSSVRYVVHLCKRKGLPQLTHAQIALICNRSRPVVTQELHRLLVEEPELFE